MFASLQVLIGNIYLYHLLTAKLCTIIQCDHHCLSLTFDPSGLYLCCVLITNTSDNRRKGGDEINVYQIGTHEFITSINCIGNIRHCSFAQDGGLLYISGDCGIIKSLSVPNGMQRNIKETLKGMRVNPYFWSKYPFVMNNRNISMSHHIKVNTYKNTHLFDERKYIYNKSKHIMNRREDIDQSDDDDIHKQIQEQYSILTTPASQKTVYTTQIYNKNGEELSVGSHINSHHIYEENDKSNTKDIAVQFSICDTPKPVTPSIEIQYDPEDDGDGDRDIVPIHTYSKLQRGNEAIETQYIDSVESVVDETEITTNQNCKQQHLERVINIGAKPKHTAFDDLYAINTIIEQSQDTDLALLDDQLNESYTNTTEFNETLKQFDDFDWSDFDENDYNGAHKYAPLNMKEKPESMQKNEIDPMCTDDEQKEQNEHIEKSGDRKEDNEQIVDETENAKQLEDTKEEVEISIPDNEQKMYPVDAENAKDDDQHVVDTLVQESGQNEDPPESPKQSQNIDVQPDADEDSHAN